MTTRTTSRTETDCMKGGCRAQEEGFTLIELLVVIAVISLLASLLFPVLSKARHRAQGIACVNNTHQLALAWEMYAHDNNGRLAYNLGTAGGRGIAPKSQLNWVNNILSWETDSDNTNVLTLAEGSLWPFTGGSASIYRCPSDNVVSDVQKAQGWSARVRSYSMNAMVGDAGSISKEGYNENNPYYAQFFNIASIPKPSEIFVFVDEHPDSINDGYFVNRGGVASWIDLPGSYHAGAAAFAFADGHSELHKWQNASTKVPAMPDVIVLPSPIPAAGLDDYYWLLNRMSVRRYNNAAYPY